MPEGHYTFTEILELIWLDIPVKYNPVVYSWCRTILRNDAGDWVAEDAAELRDLALKHTDLVEPES